MSGGGEDQRPALLWPWPEALGPGERTGEVLRSFARVAAAPPARAPLLEMVGACEILVPRLSDQVDRQLLDRGRRLRLIGTPSTGTDHIDLALAEQRGIRVVSIKDDRAFLDNVQATAELAWLLILACGRNLRAALDQVRTGGWDSAQVRGHELMDRTLGIVGYGRLGRMVGRFAQAFRMHVLAADPLPIPDPWVQPRPLDDLLAQSDIVTLHLHLTEQTRGLIGRPQLARMKRGACLVNTSRGGLVDEPALLAALESGQLAGAALDVVEGERDADRAQRPLLRYAADHPHLIITPHIGGCTVESQAKAFLFLAEKLRRIWRELGG